MESETERGRGRREGEGKMGVPGVGGTTPAHAPSARAWAGMCDVCMSHGNPTHEQAKTPAAQTTDN